MAHKWKEGELRTKSLRIQLTNGHIHNPGVWLIHVREFGWDSKALDIPNESTETQAQTAAVEMVRQHLKGMLSEL